MPRTQKAGGPALQIHVASPPNWRFAAGDTIIGTVVRRSPIVAAGATVTITLFGRVKTKISVKRSNGQSSHTEHYRGRWSLVGNETRQVLHTGPLHLANGQGNGNNNDCLSWPFEITIPTQPPPALARTDAQSFLPLGNIADHPLPGSFYSERRSFGKSSEGFVEYYLESELRYSFGNKHETNQAITLLSLEHCFTGMPSLAVRISTFRRTVQTQRLLPGMEHAKLTFKQKTQKLFKTSKVPSFVYSIELHSPSAITLAGPSPIPLMVQFSSNDVVVDNSSIPDIKPDIRLNWVQMTIKSTTTVAAPGKFIASNTHSDSHSCDYPLGLQAAISRLEKPIVFRSTQDTNGVDIGAVLQLVLHPNGLYAGNRRLSSVPTISPSFVTYNIKHEHTLKWELSLTVAEETQEMKATVPIKILPPTRGDVSLPGYS